MNPEQAGRWLCIACLMGAGLGMFYGFLRPLRIKRNWPADLLFTLGAFWVWLELSFRVCGGDIRPVFTLALLGSAALWEGTAGKSLRPVFFGFWWFIGKIWSVLWAPFRFIHKKFANFVKKEIR